MGNEDYGTGFISLHRSILSWEWYGDVNTRCLFIHLLLTAQYQDRRVKGKLVKRGQRLCSVQMLCEELGISPQKIRTALDHLKSTGEITSQSGPKGTVITIKNYARFQTAANRATNNQQTDNKLLTNKQQTTSNKRNKEINIPPKSPKGDGYAPDFLEFWEAYPTGRKKSKPTAWRAWQKLRPDSALKQSILEAVKRHAQSPDWQKDGGQFIPYPATWLNQRRWEDEDGMQEENDYGEFV